MTLLGKVLKPSVEKRIQSQAAIEHVTCRRQATAEQARPAPITFTMQNFGNVRIVVNANVSRRCQFAGFSVSEAVRQAQVQGVAVMLDHVQAKIQIVVQ